jgi:hypothetical protein
MSQLSQRLRKGFHRHCSVRFPTLFWNRYGGSPK